MTHEAAVLGYPGVVLAVLGLAVLAGLGAILDRSCATSARLEEILNRLGVPKTLIFHWFFNDFCKMHFSMKNGQHGRS